MARRLRIPGLVDVLWVSDPGEIAELAQEPAVDRPATGGRHLLNRRIASRIDPGLRFEGELLPVFRPQGARSPAEDRARMEERGRAHRSRRAPLVRELARHVAGHAISREPGVVAQELLGTLFDPDYRSDARLYADARRVQGWLGLRGLLGLGRRRLERSKRRLLDAAGGRLDAIHATAIAVHGLVEGLERMRALVADDRARTRLDAAAAAARSVAAPSVLLRSTRAPIRPGFRRRPLPAGTLVVLRLRRALRRHPRALSPFAAGGWNECPAVTLAPELLAEVWETRRREAPVPALRARPFEQLCEGVGRRVLGRFAWHKLPGWLGVVRLIGIRTWMRRERLVDTDARTASPSRPPTPAELACRSADGSYNDLDQPGMGAAGRRFGRNLPPAPVRHGLLEPNPRALSLSLMTRHAFRPAPGLNVLAAAWIQFMVHDWVNHRLDPGGFHEVEPADEDPWLEGPMRVARTLPAEPGPGEDPRYPVFENTETHWWDASQLYGSRAAVQARLREGRGGRLRLRADGRLPRAAGDGPEESGFTDNWWIGLSLFHTLFALEHNAVCAELARHNPGWSDEDLFGHARLVVAALLAKIHTLEWTPALLDHPALHITMRGTWWGVLGEWSHRTLGRFGRGDLLSGVPGSEGTHHGTAYALTEEFVSVYRMHQLLPDLFAFRSARDDRPLGSADLGSVTFLGAQREIDRTGVADALYSLGIANAGAITLHNYPAALQRLEREGEDTVDLAVIDLLRDRERGVPRYNDFRELVGLPRVRSFEELCERREDAKLVGKAYRGDLSKVDLQVGLAAERRPAGFAFGETAFRIFAVMAVRRLKSDRFFTTDYDADTYTAEGLAWVERNDLGSVLRRHYPVLGPALRGVRNPFAPWRRHATGR